MQTGYLRLAIALAAWALGGSARAEYAFRFTLAEQQPGAWIYAGFGSLGMSDAAGQFEVNVVDPYASVEFSASIVAPAGTLNLPLGTGVPTTYPFGWDFMYGTQYTGSLASSAAVLADMLAGRGELQLTAVSGTLLTAGLASLTTPGDTNGDGVVDINDLSTVLANYDRTGMTWGTGDFNGDGRVDINDLNVLLANYDKTAASALAAVPEPSTLVLVGVASLLAWATAGNLRRSGRGPGPACSANTRIIVSLEYQNSECPR